MTHGKKYVVIGGYVNSRNDNDRHYISPRQLCTLYNINPNDCLLVPNEESFVMKGLSETIYTLRPRYDGNYRNKVVEAMEGRSA